MSLAISNAAAGLRRAKSSPLVPTQQIHLHHADHNSEREAAVVAAARAFGLNIGIANQNVAQVQRRPRRRSKTEGSHFAQHRSKRLAKAAQESKKSSSTGGLKSDNLKRSNTIATAPTVGNDGPVHLRVSKAVGRERRDHVEGDPYAQPPTCLEGSPTSDPREAWNQPYIDPNAASPLQIREIAQTDCIVPEPLNDSCKTSGKAHKTVDKVKSFGSTVRTRLKTALNRSSEADCPSTRVPSQQMKAHRPHYGFNPLPADPVSLDHEDARETPPTPPKHIFFRALPQKIDFVDNETHREPSQVTSWNDSSRFASIDEAYGVGETLLTETSGLVSRKTSTSSSQTIRKHPRTGGLKFLKSAAVDSHRVYSALVKRISKPSASLGPSSSDTKGFIQLPPCNELDESHQWREQEAFHDFDMSFYPDDAAVEDTRDRNVTPTPRQELFSPSIYSLYNSSGSLSSCAAKYGKPGGTAYISATQSVAKFSLPESPSKASRRIENRDIQSREVQSRSSRSHDNQSAEQHEWSDWAKNEVRAFHEPPVQLDISDRQIWGHQRESAQITDDADSIGLSHERSIWTRHQTPVSAVRSQSPNISTFAAMENRRWTSQSRFIEDFGGSSSEVMREPLQVRCSQMASQEQAQHPTRPSKIPIYSKTNQNAGRYENTPPRSLASNAENTPPSSGQKMADDWLRARRKSRYSRSSENSPLFL